MIDIITEFDYYPQKIDEDHWIIYKVDLHHNKMPTKVYHINRWGGEMQCDCPAGGRCKHLAMIQPKKDLF
jgi:hypothetical protein